MQATCRPFLSLYLADATDSLLVHASDDIATTTLETELYQSVVRAVCDHAATNVSALKQLGLTV